MLFCRLFCRAKRQLALFTVLWALFILLFTKYSFLQFRSVLDDLIDSQNPDPLQYNSSSRVVHHFETRASARLREELSRVLRYGAQYKSQLQEGFLSTSGYDEGYFDNLPLVRTIESYSPEGFCGRAGLYSHVRAAKISVVMHFFNEPVSLVIRTVYSALLNTPQDFLHEVAILTHLLYLLYICYSC